MSYETFVQQFYFGKKFEDKIFEASKKSSKSLKIGVLEIFRLYGTSSVRSMYRGVFPQEFTISDSNST